MTFTRRTYRVAIRRAMEREQHLRDRLNFTPKGQRITLYGMLHTQIAHTRRLQQRKRRERK